MLPLANLSGDPEQESFADGMTETLIAELAKPPACASSRATSVMQFKGTKTTLPEIAKTLKVDGVIEGSVMRAGNQVRITAQLIDARADRHLWAHNTTASSRACSRFRARWPVPSPHGSSSP